MNFNKVILFGLASLALSSVGYADGSLQTCPSESAIIWHSDDHYFTAHNQEGTVWASKKMDQLPAKIKSIVFLSADFTYNKQGYCNYQVKDENDQTSPLIMVASDGKRYRYADKDDWFEDFPSLNHWTCETMDIDSCQMIISF